PLSKMAPTGMLGKRGMFEIVEGAAPHRPGGEREASGMDDVDVDAEAGTQPQHGAGVLGYIGLIEGEFDHCFVDLMGGASKRFAPGCYSVALRESHRPGRWTSCHDSAKRTPKSRAVEGGSSYACVSRHLTAPRA